MFFLDTCELARQFRLDVGDMVTDVNGGDFGCLWKDEEVYRYMTVAADAVATVVGTLYKTVRIPFNAGDATVRCPRYVLEIREARLVGANQPIEQHNANDPAFGTREDYGFLLNSNQLFGYQGRPTGFVRDYDRDQLRFTPTPSEADVLEIQCTTTPSLGMQAGIPLPFLDVKDQELMLMAMKARAYRKHDAETEDLTRAREWEQQFAHYSQERESQLRRNRRAPGEVRMNW